MRTKNARGDRQCLCTWPDRSAEPNGEGFGVPKGAGLALRLGVGPQKLPGAADGVPNGSEVAGDAEMVRADCEVKLAWVWSGSAGGKGCPNALQHSAEVQWLFLNSKLGMVLFPFSFAASPKDTGTLFRMYLPLPPDFGLTQSLSIVEQVEQIFPDLPSKN